jgi:hypothetical protein
MAGFEVIIYGRFWVIAEAVWGDGISTHQVSAMFLSRLLRFVFIGPAPTPDDEQAPRF